MKNISSDELSELLRELIQLDSENKPENSIITPIKKAIHKNIAIREAALETIASFLINQNPEGIQQLLAIMFKAGALWAEKNQAEFNEVSILERMFQKESSENES